MDRYEEASASLGRALEIQPDFPEVYASLGKGFSKQKRFDEAITCFRKVLDIHPGDDNAFAQLTRELRHICDWDGLDDREARFRTAISSGQTIFNPWFFLCLSDDPAEQLHCAKSYVENGFGNLKPLPPIKRSDPASVIRIGYISNNFHLHPMSVLLAETFETHNRDRFEIHAFSVGTNQEDDMRRRLERAFDKFHDVRTLSDHDVAQIIRNTGITVLVDLMGFQTHCRPGILAYRPAPIQATYMRHCGSTGNDYIDYSLVDAFIVPGDQQTFYTESLVTLPNCYQANQGKVDIPADTPSRRDCGLPDDAFVFCCFNNNYKITPGVFDVWMRLLDAVPGSVLWLFRDNDAAEKNLRKEAAARGVDTSRIIFAPRVAWPEHLARQRQADLFLDTFPYSAHTTGSDALRAGLPLLTLAGRSFVSRVAGSLLNAVGLPELVTRNLEEYEALALELARDPALLGAYRARLLHNCGTSSLFNCERFTRNLEAAYVKMIERWQAGLPPEAFSVADIGPTS
jgi:predicted O-linked N-acetylglucosamine transferase (SPINDLY family)